MNTSQTAVQSPAVLMGWSPETVEACRSRGWPIIAVVPPGFDEQLADGVPTITWNFDQPVDELTVPQLVRAVEAKGGGFVVPLYEETVAWAGAVQAQLLDDPEEYRKVRLFLDKAVMKHRAQMKGLKIGACEEALDHRDVKNFWHRVQQAKLKGPSEDPEPVHLKPITGGGSQGHRVIRSEAEIALLPTTDFPCVIESHLRGQEFSCEAFVAGGELVFLNITEYVELGHCNIVPAGPELQGKRDMIWEEVERLIDAFDIQRGLFHPEYFVDMHGDLSFGEVAARIPGGHIFDCIQEAYGFDPYAAFVLACDPQTTPSQLRDFVTSSGQPQEYVAAVMVYPQDEAGRLGHLVIPPEVEDSDLLVRHTLFDPILERLPPTDGYGNHLGVLLARSDNSEELRKRARAWSKIDFFPLEAGRPSEPRRMPAPKTENPPPFAR